LPRALVTGMGCVTPLGVSVPEFEDRLFAGECGLSEVRRFPTQGLRNPLAGEVKTVPSLPAWTPPVSAATPDLRFLGAAVDEALRAAGLDPATGWGTDAGCVLSTNFAGAAALDAVGPADVPPLPPLLFDAGLRMLVEGLHLRGPSLTLSMSCASGTSAIGLAAGWIRSGRTDIAIAAGYDALSLYVLAGLSILRTVSTDTCRPFDKARSGTIFSEGAAAVVVESEDRARARGAQPRAEILGHADTNNAYHLTAPDKEGEGIRLAIERALADARVAPGEIDYVNAHGTATLYHDVTEVRAVKDVLGARAYEIPVTSIKGACGHLMGAAGAIEFIASVLAIERNQAPPTLGLTDPDPECDLDHVPVNARPFPINTVLTNSAGIGGSNASLVLRGL